MVTVYEYMVFNKATEKWFLSGALYKSDEEFKSATMENEFKKTGREFKVEEY